MDVRKSRTRRQIVFKSFDPSFCTLCKRFDRAVFKIFHVTQYLVTRRRPLGEVSEPHPLHNTTDHEFPSYHNNQFKVPGSEFKVDH
jgi:hypothetical protein